MQSTMQALYNMPLCQQHPGRNQHCVCIFVTLVLLGWCLSLVCTLILTMCKSKHQQSL